MANLGLFLAAGDGIGVVFVIFIIGAVIAVIAWGAHHQKKIRENWARFAQQHGLTMQGSPARPFIQGWMGSTYVTLNTEVRGSGKNRTTYTQYHASVNSPMPSGLVMYKEGFFSKVGKVLGGQDIQTGDSAFDAAFIIKGNDLNGVQTLLRNQHVKKALMYTVTRQPALHVNERALLIEHTGMTGDLAKIEAVFADLCYLVQTFDAAHQDLVGAPAPAQKAAPQRARSAPAQPPITSRAAAAEILGASILNQPNVRRAGPEEDPAQRKQALGEVANVFQQHGKKLESQPDVLTNFGRTDAMEGKASDVFKANDPGDVFATSNSSGQSALENYNPANAWDSKPGEADKGQSGFAAFDAPTGNAFDDPKPYEAPQHEEVGEMATTFDALVAMLSDGTLMSSDRDDIIERHEKTAWAVELTVDRIDSTWGFDLAETLKDGKTVEGHAGDRKLTVRFPKSRNDEIGNLRTGATVKARGKLSGWDDLFKKATLDVG